MCSLYSLGNWQSAIDEILSIAEQNTTDNSVSLLDIFGLLESNRDRLKFVIDKQLLKSVAWLQVYFEACKSWHGKSAQEAQLWKNKGNKLFQQRKYAQAVEAYTQSCLSAPSNTGDALPLSLGNRSAALFHMQKFKECAQDIDRAIKTGIPSGSRHKLLLRKVCAFVKLRHKNKALSSLQDLHNFISSDKFLLEGDKKDTFMKDVKSAEDEAAALHSESKPEEEVAEPQPRVSYNTNSVILQATSAISLQVSPHQGRFLIANRDIPRGSTLIVEQPFAAVLLPDHYLTHCHHCFRPLPLTCIGCMQCNRVRFCNEECRDQSWSVYHRLECPYLDLLHSVGIAHLSLRIVLSCGVDYLTDFISKGSERQFQDREIKGFNQNGIYDRGYNTVYDLMTHEESTAPADLLQYSLTAALLLATLVHSGALQEKAGTVAKAWASGLRAGADSKFWEGFAAGQDSFPEEALTIGGVLLHHILQLVCNAHAITSLESSQVEAEVKDTEQVRIATAIYPTASLMNHSCDPSIVSSFVGHLLVVKAVKDLAKGDEVFNCYGPHHSRMGLEDRQEVLMSQYHFRCQCGPCSRGDVSNVKFGALKCPQCAGVLFEGNCTECYNSVTFDYLAQVDKRVTKARDSFTSGLQLMEKGQHESALKMLKDCLEERQKFLYKSHRDLALTEDVIARCYANMGDYSSSTDHLMTSVDFAHLMYGGSSPEYAHELHKLAEVLFNAERFVECVKYAGRAVELFRKLYGEGHKAEKEAADLKLAAEVALMPLMQAH